MSIDSTELTFVRCPSCRSLVPAAQTKCRMCGASLDTSGSDAKSETHDQEAAKPGRVKQRTMFGAKSELSSAAGQVRDEVPLGAEPVHTAAKEAPADDPLSAYVEEVEDEQEKVEMTPAPTAIPVTPENPPVVNGGGSPAGKFLAESGAKRSQSSSQLSFGRGNQPRPEQRAPAPAPEEREKVQEKPRHEWKEPAPAQHAARPAPVARQAEHTRAVESGRRRLFGWLVSFANPDGVASELREGKFFLTRSSLKASDMIIDNGSISTPHALINVSVKDGFQVQDLMSEQGVFVRRRGESNFERCDTTTVNHGDSIRFGEVEYLLSVVAQPGGR